MYMYLNKPEKDRQNTNMYDIPYNMVEPKTFKPNLLDEPKDMSSPEICFY